MLLSRFISKSFFSTFKVTMDTLKKLREETSAPMGQCKKALQETQGNHEAAIKWLKQKGLMSAAKRQNKQTRQGVISTFVSDCRKKAILLEANCQTDFVAKNDLFLKFVNNLAKRLLQKQQLISIQSGEDQVVKDSIEKILKEEKSLNVFPEDKDSSNALQQLKVLTSRLQENIRIRRVVTLHSDKGRFGAYVHQAYQPGIGLQSCLVQTVVVQPEVQQHQDESQQENKQAAQKQHGISEAEQIEIVGDFADNIAAQILGAPPKYLKADEIPMEVIEAETEKVREVMASALEKAPEAMRDKIVSGKLNVVFYSQCFLPCMNYILSNDGIPVSQYWQQVEAEIGGRQIIIESSKIWECK